LDDLQLLLRQIHQNPPKSKSELVEHIRKVSDSPSADRMRELLRLFLDNLEEQSPSSNKRQRAPGAGAKPKLTQDEIERGIKLLFSGKLLLSKTAISPTRACDILRAAGIGVNVSDATLRRRIVNVVRDRFRAVFSKALS
jgi:hypothetical protein